MAMKSSAHYFRRLIVVVIVTFVHGSFINSNHYHERGLSFACRHNDDVIIPSTSTLATRSSSFLRRTHHHHRKSCGVVRARPQDNLVSGISEIGLGFSLGVLWSEYSIILTGCGPLNFSDTLERICYQGVIVFSGIALFNRIVTSGKGLDDSSVDFFGPLDDATIIQVRAAEYASALAVLGAFVALAFQYSKGVSMDGLSGIDISLCRALRDL